MAVRIGVIAEDRSDVDVIKFIVEKSSEKKISILSFAAGGCGKVIGKCGAWAKNLADRGCKILILVRDLDDDNQTELRKAIAAALYPCAISIHIIVIPVREIEAWLLADHAAITKAMKIRKPIKKIANPESILRPKEKLRDLIEQASDRKISYLQTVHNAKIASECELNNLSRCHSFRPLQDFLTKNLCLKGKL